MVRALVVVDVQNDFCPGGSLATARGDDVALGVVDLIRSAGDEEYSYIVATQDWHINPGTHFSSTPDYVDSWPVHCVAETEGAAFRVPMDPSLFDAFFRKGEYHAAYSGFEGSSKGVAFGDWLRAKDVTTVDICGIATAHCVRATVLDALKQGFEVRVLYTLCAPVDEARGAAALEEMRNAGALIL